MCGWMEALKCGSGPSALRRLERRWRCTKGEDDGNEAEEEEEEDEAEVVDEEDAEEDAETGAAG